MTLDVVRKEDTSVEDYPTARQVHTVNFGALISGAFVTLGFGSIFWLFGNAIGLSAANMTSELVGMGLKTGTFVYHLVTLAAAFYCGGYATSRFGYMGNETTGFLYGLASWALAGIPAIVLATFISEAFRATFLGDGLNGANWLVFCISIIGGFCAGLGGLTGARYLITTSSSRRDIGVQKVA